MEDTNRCVCCGNIIPEGCWACPVCEKGKCLHLWQFDQFMPDEVTGRNYIKWRCAYCGTVRLAETQTREWM